jgi:hypothetical protein
MDLLFPTLSAKLCVLLMATMPAAALGMYLNFGFHETAKLSQLLMGFLFGCVCIFLAGQTAPDIAIEALVLWGLVTGILWGPVSGTRGWVAVRYDCAVMEFLIVGPLLANFGFGDIDAHTTFVLGVVVLGAGLSVLIVFHFLRNLLSHEV